MCMMGHYLVADQRMSVLSNTGNWEECQYYRWQDKVAMCSNVKQKAKPHSTTFKPSLGINCVLYINLIFHISMFPLSCCACRSGEAVSGSPVCQGPALAILMASCLCPLPACLPACLPGCTRPLPDGSACGHHNKGEQHVQRPL